MSQPGGGGARVEDDRALLRDLGQRGLRDPLLLLDEHRVTGGDGGLEPDPLDRYRSAVDPADNAGPLQGGEVAPDCLGGDAQLIGEGRDVSAAPRPGDPQDLLLPFLGVHCGFTAVSTLFLFVYARICGKSRPCLCAFMNGTHRALTSVGSV
jgi:hypothetical protein